MRRNAPIALVLAGAVAKAALLAPFALMGHAACRMVELWVFRPGERLRSWASRQ